MKYTAEELSQLSSNRLTNIVLEHLSKIESLQKENEFLKEKLSKLKPPKDNWELKTLYQTLQNNWEDDNEKIQ